MRGLALEKRRQLEQMILAGKTYDEIYIELGITPRTISKYKKLLGATTRYDKISNDKIKQISTLAAQGWTLKDIAVATGVSEVTVWRRKNAITAKVS